MHHLKYTEDYYYENKEAISLNTEHQEYVKPIIKKLLRSSYAGRFAIMGGYPIHILGKLLGIHFPFTDVDFFCFDYEVVDLLQEHFKKNGYTKSNISSNSITMTSVPTSTTSYRTSTPFKVQLIFPRIYDPQQFSCPVVGTLNTFDFTASRIVLTPVMSLDAIADDLVDISEKILRPSYYTAPSIARISKYIRKGFTLTYDMILYIATHIDNPAIMDIGVY